jgi:hypothetical protein
LTYRCFDCGLDFYAQELQEEIIEGSLADNQVIDDEEALQTAEDEVRREIGEDGDRRCW